MAFHPIRRIEAAAAKRQAELNAVAAEKKQPPERAGLYKLGRTLKYGVPILTAAVFALVFLATPGFSSLVGLLFWASIGGGSSALASRGLSKRFEIAELEREKKEIQNQKKEIQTQLEAEQKGLKEFKDKRREDLDRQEEGTKGLKDEIRRLEEANRQLLDQNADLEEAVKSGVSGISIDGVNYLSRKIGMGGMALVLEVFNKPMMARRAWKVPLPALLADPFARERFLREAQGMSQMEEHAGVVKCYDLKEISQATYRQILAATKQQALLEGVRELPPRVQCIVMELIKDPTLGTVLHETGVLTPLDAISIAIEVAQVLKEVNLKVVHRDLKPDNIFVRRKGPGEYVVKISDFGLVKFLVVQRAAGEGPQLTQAGSIVGTPEYMSYEQRFGAELDWRTDLYSLGVITFQGLTGRIPFGELTVVEGKEFWSQFQEYNERAVQIAEAMPTVINQLTLPSLPDLLVKQHHSVLRRMLDRDPKRRYRNWDEGIKDLQTVRRGIIASTKRPENGGNGGNLATDATQLREMEIGPGGEFVGPKK